MEIFISVLIGAFVSALMRIGTKIGMSTSDVFVVCAVFLGGVWTALELYGPVGLTDNVYDFASKMIGSAAIVYSVLNSAAKRLIP